VRSITDELRVRAERLKEDARQLFTAHAIIRPHRDDRFSSVVVLRLGSHSWGELPVEGERVASKLREEYDRLAEVLRVLLRSQDRRTLQELEQGRKRLRQWIDQSGDHSFKTGQEAADAFAKGLDEQLGLLGKLYGWTEAEHIYVPDTNALIFHPKIEDWSFDESPRFTLVLMPTVLAELDKHKINDRNPAVRDKAKQLVRQLMEYRRRGSLAGGVVIRKDKITLRTLAVEPDFESTLSWLDRTNDDDRILAGFIEVLRQHPRCPVFLVTADINLTNKADYAGLPCLPPPESPPASPPA
jgi:hypothetical protein